MGLIDRINDVIFPQRADPPLPFDQWVSWFNYNNNIYTTPITQTQPGTREEEIRDSFGGAIEGAYRRNGVVFACMLARSLLFTEARFQFQELRKGRPGDLFGTPVLGLLETPGPNLTTSGLLARMIQDVDLAGNWFGVRRPNRIHRLRPDWVTIVMGSDDDPDVTSVDIDAEVIGYIYHPGGRHSGKRPEFLLPETVAHWDGGIPDPQASYRGMSWITPIVREIMSDSAATSHKLTFFENAATPNMVVSLDPTIAPQAFKEFVEIMKGNESRGLDAYKTMYLGAGSTAEVVGRDFQQMDFKMVQGAGETRIAAAAGVPPIIVGLSEGLQAATYSNYGQARRRYADLTMRPLWRSAAGALASIMDVPLGSRLWYDDRDIPFLQEDVKDAADILKEQMLTIESGIRGGYTPDSVIDAVTSGDLSRMKHTGLFSVQLRPPMEMLPEETTGPILPSTPEPKQIPAETPRAEPSVTNFNFADGAFRSDPTIMVEAPPPANVTVNVPEQPAPVVNIAEGAVRSEVTVAAPPPAEVTVNVEASEPPVVNIAEGAIRADIAAPPPAEVTVNVPKADAPVVNVNVPESKPVTRSVERDDAGRITRVTETTDGD